MTPDPGLIEYKPCDVSAFRRLDVAVAIPSYRRPKTILKKTLSWLNEINGIDPWSIRIFVADRAERDSYARELGPWWEDRLVVAEPGMGAVRRFISRYYPEGQRILQVDDDVSRLVERREGVDGSCRLETFRRLPELLDLGFSACDAKGAALWGIYPCPNPRWLQPTTTTDLRYIVGCFFGLVNRHDPRLQVTLDDKEDYERTLLHYVRDGRVVRVNCIAPVTRYYSEPGGMQGSPGGMQGTPGNGHPESSGRGHPEPRTKERVLASALSLRTRFPDLCTLNTSKRSGYAELRLKDRRPLPPDRTASPSRSTQRGLTPAPTG